MRSSAVAILTLMAALTSVTAQAAPFAYITNNSSNDVSVLDTATNTVVATMPPVARGPFGVAVHPDGTRVYVTNFCCGRSVTVIDAMNLAVLASVPVGPDSNDGPMGVAVAPSGARVYMTTYKALWVLDTATNTIIATVPVEHGAYGVAVTPDGTRIYVATQENVTVLDTATNAVVTTVDIGLAAAVAVNPAGTRVYVTNALWGVSIIDTATNAVVGTVSMPDAGGVAVNPMGTRVYVTTRAGVSVIDTAINAVVAKVALDQVSRVGIGVNPAGTRVYVANSFNSVAVIDTATNSVLTNVRVGSFPIAFGLFIGPDPLANFVAGFYRSALGREPRPDETAGWLSFLRTDPTPERARVLTHAVFDGSEYRARALTTEARVAALYRAILGRDPDAVGLNGWIQVLWSRNVEMQRLVIGSPEFHSVVPDCRDGAAVRALITRLYENALGRSPRVDEINQWLFTFETNCDIEGGVSTILSASEDLSVPRTLADHVRIVYRSLLAREPRADEVDPWVNFLAAPFIEDQFIDSPEFAARWRQLLL